MSKIFISYRREDSGSGGWVGRLADRLRSEFGGDQIFMDVDTLEPGVDFHEVINEAVGSCDVLVAVIGRDWLTAADAEGNRRLDDPGDFPRLEIAAALARNVRVIPVLVNGASMPSAEQLPPDLGRLARKQAVDLSDKRWTADSQRLIEGLHKYLSRSTASKPPETGLKTPDASAKPENAAARMEPRAQAGREHVATGVSDEPGPRPFAPSPTIVLVAGLVLALGTAFWVVGHKTTVVPEPACLLTKSAQHRFDSTFLATVSELTHDDVTSPEQFIPRAVGRIRIVDLKPEPREKIADVVRRFYRQVRNSELPDSLFQDPNLTISGLMSAVYNRLNQCEPEELSTANQRRY